MAVFRLGGYAAGIKGRSGKSGTGIHHPDALYTQPGVGWSRILLSMVSVIVKYHLYGLEEMKSFQELKRQRNVP